MEGGSSGEEAEGSPRPRLPTLDETQGPCSSELGPSSGNTQWQDCDPSELVDVDASQWVPQSVLIDISDDENAKQPLENDSPPEENDSQPMENDHQAEENDSQPKENDHQAEENDTQLFENSSQPNEDVAFATDESQSASGAAESDLGAALQDEAQAYPPAFLAETQAYPPPPPPAESVATQSGEAAEVDAADPAQAEVDAVESPQADPQPADPQTDPQPAIPQPKPKPRLHRKRAHECLDPFL